MQRVLWVLTAMMLTSEVIYAEVDVSNEVNLAVAQQIPVRVTSVTRQPVYDLRTFAGTTRAVNRAVMRSQISGRVDFLPLRLGQPVKKGQVLLELYNPEAAPAAQSARVRWQQLQDQQSQQQRDFERISALYEQGQASRQDFEQARTALNSANDAVLGAESEYQRASGLNQERQIRAPFAGTITSISTDVGEVVAPGKALLQLADPTQTELELVVSPNIAAGLKVGQAVSVNFPLQSAVNGFGVNKTARQGIVKEISPFRDRSALPTVVLGFESEQVASGVAVSAEFKVLLGEEFVVPSSALVRYGHGAVVYRLMGDEANSKVEPVFVTTGTAQADGVVILTGVTDEAGKLEQDDRIVITGTQRLFRGAVVQVMP